MTRARRVHQVTVCSLQKLLDHAYRQYTENRPEDEMPMSKEDWTKKRIDESPTFQFWFLAMELILLTLVFIKSLRKGDFDLYVQALTKLVPWMFALDHTNYARWLSVHIRDMASMADAHPITYAEFQKDHFVIHKSRKRFSAMAIDQAHEQNNAHVKGDGGAVGLTENPAALKRWMLAGPDIARVISEFQDTMDYGIPESDTKHHEQMKGTQNAFCRDVKALVKVMEGMGNPFMESSGDLLVLDSKDLADPSVVKTVREIVQIGDVQYQTFMHERLQDKTKSVFDTLPRNRLPLMSLPPKRVPNKSQLKMTALKVDRSLFSRLYVACQTRGGDLNTFFKHENQAYPPSLSEQGELRHGNKSEIVTCLESLVPTEDSQPTATTIVLDGAAIVNMLKPGVSKNFDEYAGQVFMPYINAQLRIARRVDIVWDQYVPHSLKGMTRKKRGKGTRRRVAGQVPIPGNWQEFLRVDENKTELFIFLTNFAMNHQIPDGKELHATSGEDVLTNSKEQINMDTCNHEEADTRIFVHVDHATKCGHKNIVIRTVDSDVVVLGVYAARVLDIHLWIAFGTGKSFRYLAAHKISNALGEGRTKALPFFHALTGCDTASFFFMHGKKSAWATWNVFSDATEAFHALSNAPSEVEKNVQAILERFVILLYDRTSDEVAVNRARKCLFTQKGREIENIPPTEAALIQHIRRAAYQGGHVWGQMLLRNPELPSPDQWGWVKHSSGEWIPCWTVLPDASKACLELKHCGCKTGCQRRCTCKKLQLHCTALCACTGECAWSMQLENL